MSSYTALQNIKGIGEKKEKAFFSLGIESIEDLIKYYPKEYADKPKVVKISDDNTDRPVLIHGYVVKKPENIRKNKMVLTKTKVKDESGSIEIIWFHQPYLKNGLKINQNYYFLGKIQNKFGKKQMVSPQILVQPYGAKGYIIPKYYGNRNVTQKLIIEALEYTLFELKVELPDCIPIKIRKKYKLCEYNFALKNIHFPTSSADLSIAKERLIFEEFFIYILNLLLMKRKETTYSKSAALKNTQETLELIDQLPYTLTNAQKKAWGQIEQDLLADQPMNRLIQGDVGSGKTILAVLAALFAVKNEKQSCIMVPTEILAKQHYETFFTLLQPYGIEPVLLVGSLSNKEKNEIHNRIQSGDSLCIIGTHALIQEKVVFQELGLVITDEQHRFGVMQRIGLVEKVEVPPNVLVMTATPIPRTLALILYCDMDISVIDEMPLHRKPIQTYCVKSNFRKRIFDFIKKEIEAGHQAYIICPLIEEQEESNLESVEGYQKYIKKYFSSKYKTAILHGKMSALEKESIMNQFAEGNIQVLISTTVVEVGVNVPNATIMVIENAERFGLAQLHQLRGRVGRGRNQSYCILITDGKNETTRTRMSMMTKYTNGFKLSESDLQMRGPGDLLGVEQHGFNFFHLADITRDADILIKAQEAAKEVLPLIDQEKDEVYDLNHKMTALQNQLSYSYSM